MSRHTAILALGSNLGDRYLMLSRAISLIEERLGTLEVVAPIMTSEPWGYESEFDFLNTALRITTSLSPRELLLGVQGIECFLGKRLRHLGEPYRDRPIDIDILYYDDVILQEEGLNIPHPEIKNRLFVLDPLYYIEASWVDPVERKSVEELLWELKSRAATL